MGGRGRIEQHGRSRQGGRCGPAADKNGHGLRGLRALGRGREPPGRRRGEADGGRSGTRPEAGQALRRRLGADARDSSRDFLHERLRHLGSGTTRRASRRASSTGSTPRTACSTWRDTSGRGRRRSTRWRSTSGSSTASTSWRRSSALPSGSRESTAGRWWCRRPEPARHGWRSRSPTC